jgi:hypothetical protein
MSSGWSLVGGFCECSIESLCYIKDRERVLAPEEGLCCMDVINMRSKLLNVCVVKFSLSCPCLVCFPPSKFLTDVRGQS